MIFVKAQALNSKTTMSDASAAAGNSIDLPTVAAIAVIVYASTSLLHEGLGHGGACLLVGGRALRLTSASFDCDVASRAMAGKVVAAGGTIVNLVAGAVLLALFRRATGSSTRRFMLWLFATVNVMVGLGYFFYSGLTNIGDWADVVHGEHPIWLWRLGIGAGGFALYVAATIRLFARFSGMLQGDASARYRAANRAAIVAYLTGALLACTSGILNPGGLLILAISSAAASLGGTSGLAWVAQTLRGKAGVNDVPPFVVPRSATLIGVAVVVAVVFVAVFGPGVAFSR